MSVLLRLLGGSVIARVGPGNAKELVRGGAVLVDRREQRRVGRSCPARWAGHVDGPPILNRRDEKGQ